MRLHSLFSHAGQVVDVLLPSFRPTQPVTTPSLFPPHLKELTASPPRGSNSVARELKTVSFPHICLIRFTSIAIINTELNRETCGLLLGKDMGGRYVVTTLLIPKQHATSDTCAVDGEEFVIQFTEERSLITLGWVCRHLCWCFRMRRSLGHHC